MSELPPPQPTPTPPYPPAPPSPFGDDRQMLMIVYCCYILSFVVGVTGVIGVVLAYVSRDEAPEWQRSHYRFLVRTFWIGVVYFAIGFLSLFVLVGFVLVPAAMVWFLVRCALGLNYLLKRQPYPTPDSWLV